MLRRVDLAGLHDVTLRASHGVMPALDADSVDEIARIVAATTRIPGIVAYKLGLTATLRLGLEGAIRMLRRETDLPLIYDHQKAGPDVPDMAAKFAATCRAAGADGLILFPVAGPRAVDAFVGGAIANRLCPVVGGELPLADYVVSGGGYIADDALTRIFERAIDKGADHFVVPANDPEKVARLARFLRERIDEPSLFLPGIGALGGSIGGSFKEATGCRAYAVVGRTIYAAPDPGEAARRLAGEALAFA
ncbi:MAG: orotidine 5-phosphate decarboxylase [Alphaproteobacteria bacterium]|nr:orotidine 5-phosphate decarboxylase [Alphaproteobacteria bacterium]